MKAFFKAHRKLHIWLLADLCLLAAFWLCRGSRPVMTALSGVATAVGRALGRVCYRVPFSVAEALCVLLVVFALGYLVAGHALAGRPGQGAAYVAGSDKTECCHDAHLSLVGFHSYACSFLSVLAAAFSADFSAFTAALAALSCRSFRRLRAAMTRLNSVIRT